MNIHITIAVYSLMAPLLNLYDRCSRLNVDWHIFLHSQNRDVRMACEQLARTRNVHYYPYGFNRGLAKSWNEGLRMAQARGADMLMLANDDIQASFADIELLTQAAQENRDRYMISGMGLDLAHKQRKDLRFALCVINPVAIETIGYFDERFAPIYYEDWDFCRRAELAGLNRLCIEGTQIVHEGSATRKDIPDDVFTANFLRNQEYYIKKWGGDGTMHSETFQHPFNDPSCDLVWPKRGTS